MSGFLWTHQIVFLQDAREVGHASSSCPAAQALTFELARLDPSSPIKVGDLKESFYISPNALSGKKQRLPGIIQQHQEGLERLDADCIRVCLVLLQAFAQALMVGVLSRRSCHRLAL